MVDDKGLDFKAYTLKIITLQPDGDHALTQMAA